MYNYIMSVKDGKKGRCDAMMERTKTRWSLKCNALVATDALEASAARVDLALTGVAAHPLGALDGRTVLACAHRGAATARLEVVHGVEALVLVGQGSGNEL